MATAKVTTDFGSPFDQAEAVAIQPNGKIVAAGFNGAVGDFALARYNRDGTLDTSFDGDGKVTTDFGGFEQAFGVAIQPDGRIVAAGGGGIGIDFALARYNRDGSLDTSFDGDGKVTTDFGASDAASGVAIQHDGKIVAAGSTLLLGDFALARYNRDGSLDTSFDGDGKVTTTSGRRSMSRPEWRCNQTAGSWPLGATGGLRPRALLGPVKVPSPQCVRRQSRRAALAPGATSGRSASGPNG